MQIQYKSSFSNEFSGWITKKEALSTGNYEKVLLDENQVFIRKEIYVEHGLKRLCFYNIPKVRYTELIDQNQQANLLSIVFVEFENHGELVFRQAFNYSLQGKFFGTNLELYDSNIKLIASGWKNEEGKYDDYEHCKKCYYNPAINPDDVVFDCWFTKEGELMELNWNNEHIDPTGQESFVLFNTPEDIETLMQLTGMSRDLAEYFMVPEIEPSF